MMPMVRRKWGRGDRGERQTQRDDAAGATALAGAPSTEEEHAPVELPHPLPQQPRVSPPNGLVVAICGCGKMGCAVAGELLRRGCTVLLVDTTMHSCSRAICCGRARSRKTSWRTTSSSR